jgi:hypothetical protein
MNEYLYGMLTMGAGVIALLFLRAYRLDRDRLFAFFAAAFGVPALTWLSVAAVTPSDETRYFLYVPRLLAFGLIIGGIVDKNRRYRRRGAWR